MALGTPPIRVAVIDDSDDERRRIAGLIQNEPAYQLVASCSTRAHAEALLPKLTPDIVLLDLMVPGVPRDNETEFLVVVRTRFPKTRVIIVTVNDDPAILWRAISAGASGYLVKPVAGPDLLRALQDVCNGGAVFTPAIAARLIRHFENNEKIRQSWNLTRKEREALERLSMGVDRDEVCLLMGIKVAGLRTHLQNIYQKLHVQNESAAVAKFIGLPPQKQPDAKRAK